MQRTIAWTTLALLLGMGTVGCSKHECSFDSDAEKEAFGEIADMTEGAFRCDVKGQRAAAGLVMNFTDCEVGSEKECVATLETSHGDGAKHEQVADGYKAYLEKNGWKVDKSEYEGKRGNGKDLTGTKLRAEKGDDVLLIQLYNLADTIVEASTLRVDKSMVKPEDKTAEN